MIIHEDQCCGCPKEMGCLGDSCPNRNVTIYLCDACENEVDLGYEDLYEYDGKQLCLGCLLEEVGATKYEP